MGNGVSIPGCKADTLPHLVTNLKMRGTKPPSPYAVKTCTGTTLPLLNSCAAPSDTESEWLQKVRVTVFFVQAMKRMGGAEVLLHAFLFWTPNGGAWLDSRPCRFSPTEISSDMH
jgi:hypothetical protein